jgi:hypothetical protein
VLLNFAAFSSDAAAPEQAAKAPCLNLIKLHSRPFAPAISGSSGAYFFLGGA